MTNYYGLSCATHCCKWHGCKYGYRNDVGSKLCAVVHGGATQLYPCEWCSEDYKEYLAYEAPDRDWLSYMQRWVDDGGML